MEPWQAKKGPKCKADMAKRRPKLHFVQKSMVTTSLFSNFAPAS